MAIDGVKAPNLPSPPKEYDQVYLNNLVRSLNTYFTKIDSSAGINASTVSPTALNLPVSADTVVVNGTNNNVKLPKASFIRISDPTANFTITGIETGFTSTSTNIARKEIDGRTIVIFNSTSYDMVISDQNANSTAGNRIITNTGGDITTTGPGAVALVYSVTDSRWVVTASPVASGSDVAPADATYVTLSTNGTLTNERVLTAGTGISLTDAGAGSTITIASTGAPSAAQYVTLATDSTLTNERVLTAGTGISLTDAGAGSTVTIASTGAPAAAQYVTLATDSTLTSERVLTAGSGITINDGGAGGAVTISTSGGTTTGLFVNKLINGAMNIDQRQAGGSVSNSTAAPFNTGPDRWVPLGTIGSKFTIQRSQSSPPTGFTSFLRLTSSSTFTLGSSDKFHVKQGIEASSCTDLYFGTGSAQSVTISFWARCSLTAPVSIGCVLAGNGSVSRSYPFLATTSATNTWEYFTKTIPGDTSGTWPVSSGVAGLYLFFSMGAGSTHRAAADAWTGTADIAGCTGQTLIVQTNAATLDITGVQLEVGTTASAFQWRPFQIELLSCQRYFEKTFPIETAVANGAATTGCLTFPCTTNTASKTVTCCGVRYEVTKAYAPTVTLYHITGGASNQIRNATTGVNFTSSGVGDSGDSGFYIFAISPTGTPATGDKCQVHWASEAELLT